jgi:subtilisin family serine protease
MRREGFIVFTVRSGEAPEHVPAHLDWLTGAARTSSQIDGGPIDRVLRHRGDGFRATLVFHARASLGIPAEHHVGFDDSEERLGLSRMFRVRLGDPSATNRVLDGLRSLDSVESACAQQFATAPFEAALAEPVHREREVDAELAREPYERIGAGPALAIEPGDERVTVACVDTGVALGHPELQRKLLAGYNTVDIGVGTIGRGLRLVGDSRGRGFSPLDEVGHGSHVAGIIGAQGWRIPKGIAGRALMLPIRVLAAAVSDRSTTPVGVGARPDIDAGMKVAVDLGARVINMSFGTPATSLGEGAPQPHAPVVRYATDNGCVLVAAAGNSGKQERFYPAALPEVIAVGSASRDGRRSSFSTWGSHVALCAPGEHIVSCERHGYRAGSGTSFAAPFVTAAAALVVSRGRRDGRELSPGEVREALTASARPLQGGANPETGSGLLDVAGAVRRVAVHPSSEPEARHG